MNGKSSARQPTRRALLAATLAAARLACALAEPPASNPFCGTNTARNVVPVTLACAAGAGVISAIDFASYGTPSGSCSAGWAHNASCDAPNALAAVQSLCLNQSVCTVTGGAGPLAPDPCPEVVKSVAVVARCSGSPGGFQVVVQPSCATTDGFPPCPLPTWTPTYQLNRSTICQPGNTDGFLDAKAAARWGLISLDWSIAGRVWMKGCPHTAASNTTGQATLVEQCRQIKAVDPTTKCLVYRNTELALEWMETQRVVMYDPTRRNYFMQDQPGNPGKVAPGTIYSENAGGPADGCNQFLWNYSNAEAAAYVLSVSEQGALGTGSPFVDGTFLDDSQAIPQEHPDAPYNLGLNPLQLAVLQNDTYRFVQSTIETLAASGHYIWQGALCCRARPPCCRTGRALPFRALSLEPFAARAAARASRACASRPHRFPSFYSQDSTTTPLATQTASLRRPPRARAPATWTWSALRRGSLCR